MTMNIDYVESLKLSDPIDPNLSFELHTESGQYKCLLCDKAFKQKSNARTHFKGVHLNERQECRICGLHVRKLKAHINDVHRKESLVPCKICGKLYFAGRLISDHMKKTHGVKLDKFNGDGIFIFNKCEICNILVPCKKMSAHMMAKHNHLNSGKRKSHDTKVVTRYKIKDGIAIAAKVDLDDNKNDDEAEDYVGDLKTSTFVVSEEGKILDDNEKTDSVTVKESTEDMKQKLFEIIIPTSNASSSFKINVDVKLTDELLYSDMDNFINVAEEGCDLLEEQKPNLSDEDLSKYIVPDHIRKTGSNNKYQSCPSRQAHFCPICTTILKSKDALRRHIAVVHKQLKTISCEICNKSFVTKADLRKHHRSNHDADKDLLIKCDICKELVKKSYLNRHKSYKHSNNKLSKTCKICDKQFNSREVMLRHARTVHKDKAVS